jgi:hypothetical protein
MRHGSQEYSTLTRTELQNLASAQEEVVAYATHSDIPLFGTQVTSPIKQVHFDGVHWRGTLQVREQHYRVRFADGQWRIDYVLLRLRGKRSSCLLPLLFFKGREIELAQCCRLFHSTGIVDEISQQRGENDLFLFLVALCDNHLTDTDAPPAVRIEIVRDRSSTFKTLVLLQACTIHINKLPVVCTCSGAPPIVNRLT